MAAKMVNRTTFALDRATTERLKRLAEQWQTSQAEVVRRALERAEAQANAEEADPIAGLRQLQQSNQSLSPEAAESYLTEVYQDRHRWRDQ